jgi:hypothetical protein
MLIGTQDLSGENQHCVLPEGRLDGFLVVAGKRLGEVNVSHFGRKAGRDRKDTDRHMDLLEAIPA